jgi:hypothetical protein
MHRLYQADHHDWAIIRPSWLRLSFPFFWGYSTLRSLWVSTRLGRRDKRIQDALAALRRKQLADWRWPLEATPWGHLQMNLEKKGQPSKWVTLLASSILRGQEESDARCAPRRSG